MRKLNENRKLLLSTPYYKESGPSEVEMKVVVPMDDVYPTDERACGLMVHGTLNGEFGPPTGIWINGRFWPEK